MVGELSSDVMEPHHWEKVIQITSVYIDYHNAEAHSNPKTADLSDGCLLTLVLPGLIWQAMTLADLTGLQIHNHMDAITEVVDRARKEAKISSGLRNLAATWGSTGHMYFGLKQEGVLELVKAPDSSLETS